MSSISFSIPFTTLLDDRDQDDQMKTMTEKIRKDERIELVLSRPGLADPAERHWGTTPPLGLAYLASAARSRDISVKIIDGKMEGHLSADETLNRILDYSPLMVGLSTMTVDYPTACTIAAALKQHNAGIVTVLGGAHANALPEKSLIESPSFDFVIAGEGEQILPELFFAITNRGELDQIPGLFRREDGKVKNSIPSLFCTDLSQLPFPAWDLFPPSTVYPVMTTRGCPFGCVFCSKNMSRKIRKRPLEHVTEEIEWLCRNHHPREIHFEDETFGLPLEPSLNLLRWLVTFNRTAKVRFKAQTRADCVTRPMMRLMKEAGIEYIELGVESGDPDILAQSGKGIRLDQVDHAVSLAREEGLKIWLKFILGLPGENRRSIRKTIDYAVKMKPNRLSVATIVAYPGSAIYEWACRGKKGYRFSTRSWSTFDKYLHTNLQVNGLSGRTLKRYQIQMYFETYLRNRRFLDLAAMVLKNKTLAWSILRNLI